jgi:hypothetical protein
VAAKTPKEAAEKFVDFLKETLSCISDQFVSAYPQSQKLYKVYYEPYAPVVARTGENYSLSITQIFRTLQIAEGEFKGQYKAKTQEYSYRLIEGSTQEEEVLAYHWHPNDPGVQFPHLHIKAAHRIHFPTSRVCLEDFVYLLIRDYKIVPRLKHAEYTEILERNKKAFEKMATWKIHH